MEANAPGPLLFFGKDQVLSNFYDAPFRIDGVRYFCSEQFYMSEKAIYFGDGETRDKIMRAVSAPKVKRLGKRVEGFDEDRWGEVKLDVMRKALHAKFTQNAGMRLFLKMTFPRILAEASPVDTFWGIGLSKHDPRARVVGYWQGQNWMGRLLAELRAELIREDRREEAPACPIRHQNQGLGRRVPRSRPSLPSAARGPPRVSRPRPRLPHRSVDYLRLARSAIQRAEQREGSLRREALDFLLGNECHFGC